MPAHSGEAVLAACDVCEAKAFINLVVCFDVWAQRYSGRLFMEPIMAKFSLSSSHIDHLRRAAKKLQASEGVTLTQAQDQIARQKGFGNWSLLIKNGSATEPGPLVEFVCTPYPGGDPGVFLLTMRILSQELKERVLGYELHFELPAAPGWLFRPATEGGGFAPFLDGRVRLLQGVFHQSEWQCILSRNGVQDHEYPTHLKTLEWVLGAVQIQAEAALKEFDEQFVGDDRQAFRLFHLSRPGAVSGLIDIGFNSLEKAQSHALPPGDQPVAIRAPDGWYTYQAPFGWEGPYPAMQRQ